MTHNAVDQPGLAVASARTHRRDAVDELDLADRPHGDRAAGAVHGARFDKHRRDDIVATADVRREFMDQVTAALPVVPHVMMRIDNRQVGLERRLPALLRPRRGVGERAIVVAAKFVRLVHLVSPRGKLFAADR